MHSEEEVRKAIQKLSDKADEFESNRNKLSEELRRTPSGSNASEDTAARVHTLSFEIDKKRAKIMALNWVLSDDGAPLDYDIFEL